MSILTSIRSRLSSVACDAHVENVVRKAGPSYVRAWQAIDDNDPDTAAKLLQEIRAQNSTVPAEDVLMLEASIMGLRGLHRQCVEFLETALTDHRSSLDPTLALAWNYMKVAAWDKAIDTYSASLQLKGVGRYEDEIRDSIAFCRQKLASDPSGNGANRE